VLRHAHQFDEAITQAQRALDLNPNYGRAHAILGHCYLAKGNMDAAIDEHRRSSDSSGNLGFAYAVAGRTKEASDILADMQARYAATRGGPGEIAIGVCPVARLRARIRVAGACSRGWHRVVAQSNGHVGTRYDPTRGSISSYIDRLRELKRSAQLNRWKP
jgi:tetratricopeptide (TPR) repeat protein